MILTGEGPNRCPNCETDVPGSNHWVDGRYECYWCGLLFVIDTTGRRSDFIEIYAPSGDGPTLPEVLWHGEQGEEWEAGERWTNPPRPVAS